LSQKKEEEENCSFKVKHFAKCFLKKKPAPYEHYLISRSMYLRTSFCNYAISA
jgi:hypothetical protein